MQLESGNAMCRMLNWKRRVLVVGLLPVLVLSSAVLACQVPVFRYALERWQPDRYQLVVLSAGELPPIHTALLEPLVQSDTAVQVRTSVGGASSGESSDEGVVAVAKAAPGIAVRRIDITATNDPMFSDLWKRHASQGAPVLVTLYPECYQVDAGQIAHACELTAQGVAQVIDSPKRQELAKRLSAGHSAVWILLESGDQTKDDAAAKALETQLRLDTQWLALPTPEELEIKPEVLANAKIQLRIEFSVLRIPRDDPQELFLIDCLLNSEPDLRSFDEPLAFPVFGRGRVLYALVGKGISSNTIRAASSFMVGPCSCQVKEQNPGFDLLLQCDWKAAIGETFISSPLPEVGQAEPRLLKIPPGRASR